MRWLGLGILSTLGNDHVHHRSCTSSENAAEEVEADDNVGMKHYSIFLECRHSGFAFLIF